MASVTTLVGQAWEQHFAALRLQEDAIVKRYEKYVKEKELTRKKAKEEERIRRKALIQVSDTESEDDSDKESVNSEDPPVKEESESESESEEEEDDSEDEAEKRTVDNIRLEVHTAIKAKPIQPPRPTGSMWPVSSRQQAIEYAEVSFRACGCCVLAV